MDGRHARLVAWLGAEACALPALVGAKAANLSLLARDFPVPAGFCLTAEAYRRGSAAGGLDDDTRSALERAYAELAADDPGGGYVAVRSSALDEDGASASFAGQHDTVLNVRGIEAVVAAVEASWASLEHDAALAYRRTHGLEHTERALAVVVQRMVWADAAGVAFSVDPLSGADIVVISAAWGLGESVVAGTSTTHTWRVDPRTPQSAQHSASAQERMVIPNDTGVVEVAVPRLLRDRPPLDEAQVAQVVTLVGALEQRFGWPVDIEFAWRDDALSLLQCRPVTRAGASA